CLQENNWSYSF
nr:immunoglobulin light chain junction region [Macaca mulatta]MOV84745.1 immunoglobulin light chain junction region [Macaca mulatta]